MKIKRRLLKWWNNLSKKKKILIISSIIILVLTIVGLGIYFVLNNNAANTNETTNDTNNLTNTNETDEASIELLVTMHALRSANYNMAIASQLNEYLENNPALLENHPITIAASDVVSAEQFNNCEGSIIIEGALKTISSSCNDEEGKAPDLEKGSHGEHWLWNYLMLSEEFTIDENNKVKVDYYLTHFTDERATNYGIFMRYSLNGVEIPEYDRGSGIDPFYSGAKKINSFEELINVAEARLNKFKLTANAFKILVDAKDPSIQYLIASYRTHSTESARHEGAPLENSFANPSDMIFAFNRYVVITQINEKVHIPTSYEQMLVGSDSCTINYNIDYRTGIRVGSNAFNTVQFRNTNMHNRFRGSGIHIENNKLYYLVGKPCELFKATLTIQNGKINITRERIANNLLNFFDPDNKAIRCN